MKPYADPTLPDSTREAMLAAAFSRPAAGGTSDNGVRGYSFAPEPVRRPMTEREKQILRLVCEGLSNAEIAVRLGIAPDTVKSELKRIFRKIEVKNRTQAAVLMVRQGLF